MRNLFAVLALVATPAFAQFEDLSFRVTPNHGPVTGETVVTLEGEFRQGLADPCVGATVSIGGKSVTTNNYDNTKVVFVTDPYTPGRFDVTVDICGARAEMKNAFTYGAAWERVLLPVYLDHDVGGAHGSVWRTDFATFRVFGRVTGEPQGHTDGPLTSDEHVAGRMLFLGEGAERPGETAFNLRIRDVSRAAENAGTELPAVREDNAFGPFEMIRLLNIPVGPNYRAKLRVYRIDTGDPGVMQFYVSNTDILLLSERLVTSPEPMTGGFLLYPGYAEYDLDKIANIGLFDRVNVELLPPFQGLYWAFVAVTNNETQQITTVTPQ